MTEIERYIALAREEINPSNGAEVVGQMEKVSVASFRVGEMLVDAEHTLLDAQSKRMEGLEQYEFSEAKIKRLVDMDTVKEVTTVKVLKNLLTGLTGRFKALQSALSYLKSERNKL